MPSAAKAPAKVPKKSAAKTLTNAKPAVPKAAAKTAKLKLKVPLIRDSFTMPAADFDLIAAMKLRALKLMRPAKKSELLRAGLHALAALSDTRLVATLNVLTPLKPGRPKKAD